MTSSRFRSVKDSIHDATALIKENHENERIGNEGELHPDFMQAMDLLLDLQGDHPSSNRLDEINEKASELIEKHAEIAPDPKAAIERQRGS